MKLWLCLGAFRDVGQAATNERSSYGGWCLAGCVRCLWRPTEKSELDLYSVLSTACATGRTQDEGQLTAQTQQLHRMDQCVICREIS